MLWGEMMDTTKIVVGTVVLFIAVMLAVLIAFGINEHMNRRQAGSPRSI